MPANSKAQRIAMAIAERHPEELSEKNKGLADMTHKQLHDFASTPEKGLPEHAHKKASYKAARDARKD
jgi:Rod binding domain-containing protein